MTRGERAIQDILPALRDDPAVRGVFLAGSFACGDADEHSDVDLACVVRDADREPFLAHRRAILERYRPIVAWAEVNHIGPQVVAIYDDALQLDLTAVADLSGLTAARALHDPDRLIDAFVPRSLARTPEETRDDWLSFGYAMVEYERAVRRGQRGRASNLLFWMARYAAGIASAKDDPSRAQLAVRSVDRVPASAAIVRAMARFGPDDHPAGVLLLMDAVESAAKQVPGSEAWNWPLFELMRRRMHALSPTATPPARA